MAKEKIEKHDEYAVKILSHLQEMFNGESDNNIIDLSEFENADNGTAFIHALANIVPNMIFTKITGNEQSNLEFNHIANTLCFQFSKPEQSKKKNGK